MSIKMKINPAAARIIENLGFDRQFEKARLANRVAPMCVEGCLLYESGVSLTQLNNLEVDEGDRRTAEFLWLPVTLARWLRTENDLLLNPVKPLQFFTNPEDFLGPNWAKILYVWHVAETTRPQDWRGGWNEQALNAHGFAFKLKFASKLKLANRSWKKINLSVSSHAAAEPGSWTRENVHVLRLCTAELIQDEPGPLFLRAFKNFGWKTFNDVPDWPAA